MAKSSNCESANLLYAEKNGVEFFATGDSRFQIGLDLNFIPHEKNKGVNLSSTNQNLRQSFLTAKHIFEHVAPGTIKFVLIGLTPFSECLEDNLPDDPAKVDLNSEQAKATFRKKFSEKALISATNSLTVEELNENIQALEEYIKLCRENKAKPIGVIFPANLKPIRNYDADILELLYKAIKDFQKSYKFQCIDLFDVGIANEYFYGATYLSQIGASAVSALLGEKLYMANVISVQTVLNASENYLDELKKHFPEDYALLNVHVFCELACKDFYRLPENMRDKLMTNVFLDKTYNYFEELSKIFQKDDYNALLNRVFEISLQKIRRKDKIKLGFVLHYSSMWCGDELYNLFARDKRFEPTVFLCVKNYNELIHEEFMRDIEKFKSRGLNLVALEGNDVVVPEQDILIYLTPYMRTVPNAFRTKNIKPSTLMVNIPYTLSISIRKRHMKDTFFCILYKRFFPSTIMLQLHDKICPVGMPRGLYSGYPRMDIFFQKDAKFHFDWKMTRPKAKKIIWAPHWSINAATKWATFQWNYQFMYEFAKSHPETSWVVKPHPHLQVSAVTGSKKVFSSLAELEKYFQKWNDLPNAQVYTGAYYQDIFVTSDGMIHDSGSFTAEYQYVDKPMIFLTRANEKFNELGDMILKASYLVDGKDFNSIAAMIQRVFIEGDDYKAAERKIVFDKHLNYPKANGLLASEFIYKSIANDLKPTA